MDPLRRIRFVTANFSALQGLTLVPIGLFLMYAYAFDDAQIGRANRDLTVPCLLLPLTVLAVGLIRLYYARTFGRVQSEKRAEAKDLAVILGFLAVGWGAFAVDSLKSISVSLFAFFLALVLLLAHVNMARKADSNPLKVFPAGLVCIGLVFLAGFLPLAGSSAANVFGLHSAFSLAGAAVGGLYALYGVMSHLFLVRSLPSARSENGQTA